MRVKVLFVLIFISIPIQIYSYSSIEKFIDRKNSEKKLNKENITLKLIKTYDGFSSPTSIAIDNDENIYVSDWSNNSIIRIDKNDRYEEYTSGLGSPAGLIFDKYDNLYIADYNRDIIYNVTPSQEKEVFIENLNIPTGISLDKEGNLLIANRGNDEIVKVSLNDKKIISVFKGMKLPVGVVEDENGNLFVSNYGGDIRKISKDGKVSSLPNKFLRPGVGITIDSMGELFAVDNGQGCVRQLFDDGTTKILINNISGCVGLTVHKNMMWCYNLS